MMYLTVTLPCLSRTEMFCEITRPLSVLYIVLSGDGFPIRGEVGIHFADQPATVVSERFYTSSINLSSGSSAVWMSSGWPSLLSGTPR